MSVFQRYSRQKRLQHVSCIVNYLNASALGLSRSRSFKVNTKSLLRIIRNFGNNDTLIL